MTTYLIGPGQTYETFTALEAAVVLAPDDIVDGGGNTFKEIWKPATSGTDGHPIILQNAYITGADAITTWVKTSGQTNVYESIFTINANIEVMIWEDDCRLTKQVSIAAVNSTPGSFYNNVGLVYVHANDSSSLLVNNKNYEGSARTICLDIETNYITATNVNATKAAGDDTTLGAVKLTGSNVVYKDSASHNNRRHSLSFYVGCDNAVCTNLDLYDTYGSFAFSAFGEGTDDNLLQSSRIHDSFALVVVHGTLAGDSQKPERTTIKNCLLYNATTINYSIQVYSAVDTLFQNNHIYGTHAGYMVMANNGYISGLQFYGNIFDITSTPNYECMFINAVSDIKIYHNYFFGDNNKPAIRAYGGAFNITIKNNILDGVDEAFRFAAGSTTNVIIDYNSVSNVGTRYGRWADVAQIDLASWVTASNQEINSIFIHKNGAQYDVYLGSAPSTIDHTLSYCPVRSDGRLVKRADNPLLNSGVVIAGVNDGGELDIWGNATGETPNIGAYQGDGVRRNRGFLMIGGNMFGGFLQIG